MAPLPAEELVAEVRLSLVSGVGPRLRANLVALFGSVGDALRSTPADLCRADGIGPKLAARIAAATVEIDAESELEFACASGIDVLTCGEARYPAALREIHDPPAVLYVRGELTERDDRSVAIVGTRHATRYGLAQARQLSAELARAGFTVVSGLARGVDGAAHVGALEAGGRTIAVMAGGLTRIYPPEHRRLAEQVAERSALVTEAPPRMAPLSGAFPQRNRVISGLTLGTVVVEAADRSGALITARHAAEQGREVFAVPGPIDSRQSRGCHTLIQEGAKLVASVDDILEELSILRRDTPATDAAGGQSEPVDLSSVEAAVFGAINPAPTAIDHVITGSGLPVHEVLATVSMLEMRRLIRRVSGTFVERA